MRRLFLTSVVCGLALAVACARPSTNPSSPSSVTPAKPDAAADGSTLKATAPALQSPVNSLRLTFGTPVTLVVGNSTTPFVSGVPLTYKFEIYNAVGTKVYTSPTVNAGSGTTSHTVTATLDGDQTFTWQARAEYQGNAGPWSSRATFITAVTEPDGYIRGNELYDPLTKGTTVGVVHGPVTFIPGVGVRLEGQTSYVSYELQQPLFAGEISMLMTNIVPGASGLKTKVFSMSQGYDDITTNARRFTVEKRGSTEPGSVAWRVIANEGAIETVGDERRVVSFQPTSTYFWRATWASEFRLTINQGGVTGPNVYDFSRGLLGTYDPNPHVVFLGSPETRSGPDSQTAPGIVIRQVWVSRNTRPDFASR
jgi:hypothetical protein